MGFGLFSFLFRQACMNPLYVGEGLPGRLLNSPWNCVAM